MNFVKESTKQLLVI